MFGSEWQYEYFISPFSLFSSVRVTVYPPPPKNPVNVIVPFVTATYSHPCGAAISIPLWNVDAPEVGACLFPKYEFIPK